MVTEPRAGETLPFLTVLSLLKMLSATVGILTIIFKTFVCVCRWVHMHVRVYMWKSEDNLTVVSQATPTLFLLFVLSQGFSLAWNLPNGLASQSFSNQSVFTLPLPWNYKSIRLWHHAWLFSPWVLSGG